MSCASSCSVDIDSHGSKFFTVATVFLRRQQSVMVGALKDKVKKTIKYMELKNFNLSPRHLPFWGLGKDKRGYKACFYMCAYGLRPLVVGRNCIVDSSNSSTLDVNFIWTDLTMRYIIISNCYNLLHNCSRYLLEESSHVQ